MESVMELTAQSSPRSTETLRAALRGLQADGITFAEISKSTEVHRTAISQLVNQGILPSPKHVASLWSFVDRQREAQEMPDMDAPAVYKQALEIWETEEYVLAKGWCDYIYQKRKMGVLIGAPGTGKTTILKKFALDHPGSIYIEAMPNMRVNDLLNAIAHRAGISLKGNGCQRMEGLIEALAGRTDLRKIWDNTGTPVILAGTPELETTIKKGTGKDNLAQLYRRKYELQLKGISAKTALTHLRHYHLTTDAAEMLAKIGADVQHGGLGNLVEILDLCLEAAAGGEINADMVKAAKQYKLMY